MSPTARTLWTFVWAGTLLVVLLAVGGCATSGTAAIAAQQVKLPPAPASLSKRCDPPAAVAAGDDLRRSLDAALVWGNCSAAEVAAWQVYYAGLRGR